MIDIQQKNAVGSEAIPQDGGVPVSGAIPEVCPDPPKMSKGEKAFEAISYTGLNYWVNLISSIVMADYMLRSGSGGRKVLDKMIEKTAIGVHKLGVPLKTAFSKSKTAIETGTLLLGGTVVVMPPLKWLEDNKRKVVHWLNDKLGVDQTAPDGHKETADEIHIEKEQPHQSWGRVLARRVYCIATVMFSGVIINDLFKDKNKLTDDHTYKIAGQNLEFKGEAVGGKQRITEKVFGWLDKTKEHFTGKKFEHNALFSRLTQLFILDSAFTYITKVVMYMTTGAEKAKMPQEIDNSNDPEAHLKKNKIVRDEPQLESGNDTYFADKVGKKELSLPTKKEKLRPEDYINLGSQSSVPVGVGV